eukprot:607676-Rhodomonas_salina.1
MDSGREVADGSATDMFGRGVKGVCSHGVLARIVRPRARAFWQRVGALGCSEVSPLGVSMGPAGHVLSRRCQWRGTR